MLVAVIFACLGAASSFTAPLKAKRRFASSTALGGWLDFKPIHGSGSMHDDKELDEMWEAQQEILRARRGHGSKDHLKHKYGKKKAADIETPPSNKQVDVSKKQDSAMYVEDENQPKFKFPWQK